MKIQGVLILICGVAGSGKTSLAKALAEKRGGYFIDADDLHSLQAREKMGRGEALNDLDRGPWMDRLCDHLKAKLEVHAEIMLACSALKNTQRQRLLGLTDQARLIFLAIPEATARRRIELRNGHYFPPALIRSQYLALEVPGSYCHIDACLEESEILTFAEGLLSETQK